MQSSIAPAHIVEAHDRIRNYIHRTPILTCQQIDDIAGCEIYFKCENFQKVGAFKARGGLNAVLSLSPQELEKGVTTHSSGNHAQAIALAAKIAGTHAYIVMPENAPRVKVDAVRGYDGEVIFCKPTLEARETTVQEVIREKNATFIHPYNDERIICGQATAAKELIEDLSHLQLDSILAPVGGGGLLSGTALAASFFSQIREIYGCEPEGADDAFQSFRAGVLIPQRNPQTVADGLRTSLGEKTFAVISDLVSDILLADDQEIVAAMELIWQRMKIIIEPSCATPLAAVLRNPHLFAGKKIGIILSGGNVDIKFGLDGTRLTFSS
ncbi:pyridoxal-phosphate dependent enzyme [Fulvivirga sedimenti]|uniref:Pyridoxal-phosphate dependent enzyme n=1 Tax=Fulvivirga sedimenti TaxID=2879465 RepID=A0A9X1HV07_9BACT|nr:pyridoxal-phosphate dependent enzyme [Fulvivirga sedimenti]MCA6078411.1 pyridoxal-phosphate dependent enzyme [Fulvivirga sedimenti]